MQRRYLSVALLLFFLGSASTYELCGNGVVDNGELCDTALTACCNATCTGVFDYTSISFPHPTCFAGTYNYARLDPMLTRDEDVSITWYFSRIPAQSSPTISNPHRQDTYFTFNSNGLYELSVQIDNACGTYFTNDYAFMITDCCGNGVVDVAEQCDVAVHTNGCCDPSYCIYAEPGTDCVGDINDACTQALACDALGQCVSMNDSPYALTPLQSQNIDDASCSLDVRTFTLRTQLDDPLDSTPGNYSWSAVIVSSEDDRVLGYPLHHSIYGGDSGVVAGPSSVITYSVKMIGGGGVTTLLTVVDPCGLTETLEYNITRHCCGNGILNANEACDTTGNPYCSSDCMQVVGWCGDGIVQGNEVCDYKIDACCAPTCTSLLAPGTLCRAKQGECDVAEYCVAFNASCPDDVFLPSTHECRHSMGGCDSAETCSGYDPLCPNENLPYPAGTLCREPAGVCEQPGYCDGLSYGCPVKSYRSGDVCRHANFTCDLEERCIFGNSDCPADVLAPNGTLCSAENGCYENSYCNAYGVCDYQQVADACANINTTAENNTVTANCTGRFCSEQWGCLLGMDGWTNQSDYVYPKCTIDGACYNDGDANPFNQCQYCNSSANVVEWTTHADETPCHTEHPEGGCSTQDVCLAGACVDRYLSEGEVCRAARGSCDVEEVCAGDTDLCPIDAFHTADVVCRASSGECDIPETCSGSGPFCPSDRVRSNTALCRQIVGPCDVPETCDGVSKTCPLDLFKSTRTMCREPTGECDRPEYCSGVDALCPVDAHYGPEVVCRGAVAPCDIEERCTGFGINCPPDVYADATRICRHPEGLCDLAEHCTGTSVLCPYDAVKRKGDVCRVSEGVCDPEEVCTGTSKHCPQNEFSCSEILCRRAVGPCDKEEFCDGISAACPADEFRGPRFVCRPKCGLCDQDEYCTLGTTECPGDEYLASGEVCRKSKGRCDLEETCTGHDSQCPPDELQPEGVVCRDPIDVCDRPEVCNGVDYFCPENGLEPCTTICRPSASPCDPPEHCTGEHPACPRDRHAPTSTICREPPGSCALPGYCLGNGTCPSELLVYGSDHLCHRSQSQCDYDVYCDGENDACPYYFEDLVVGSPCRSSGLTCRQDVCTDVDVCTPGSISTCHCSQNSDCGVTDDSCLSGYCANYYCQKTVHPGKCFIDGLCLSDGDVNPFNSCQYCNHAFSSLSWAHVAAGTHCNTGNDEGDCSSQDTCNNVGECVDNYRVGHVCREEVGDCDIEDRCVGGNDWCPEDVYRASAHVCREAIGECDLAEMCSGASPYCPNDMFYSPTHVCRLPVGACDHAEKCTGEDAHCPRDVYKVEGEVCRELAGPCDMVEKCDGLHPQCPGDRLRPLGWTCRCPVGGCDHPETCDGVSTGCPVDTLYPSGTVCRHKSDLCDREEMCDGVSSACPSDLFEEAGLVCRIAVGTCDASEHCTGTSKECPSDAFKSSDVVCRSAAGLCDRPETCTGFSNQCPVDDYYSSEHLCRAAKNKCDVTDYCSGNDRDCPYDDVRPAGYPCPDSDYCNGDEFCDGTGHCLGADAWRNCSRPRSCLVDTCDEITELCVHTQLGNIGQACYTGPPGTLGVGICKAGAYTCNPAIEGLACTGETTPKPFDWCGNEKDDDCNGVVDDGCFTGVCTFDAQCVNSPIDSCHSGSCNTSTGKCVYTLNATSYCFIDDRCHALNDYKRHDPCLRCYPNVSTGLWTANNQANVSDFNVCNGGEQCVNGKVVVDPPPLKCHHLSGPCRNGVCDPTSGCYSEFLPDGHACTLHGSTCSVEFTCQSGICVCDGQRQSTTRGSRVFSMVFLSLFLVLLVGVFGFILLKTRYGFDKNDVFPPKEQRYSQRVSESVNRMFRVNPKKRD